MADAADRRLKRRRCVAAWSEVGGAAREPWPAPLPISGAVARHVPEVAARVALGTVARDVASLLAPVAGVLAGVGVLRALAADVIRGLARVAHALLLRAIRLGAVRRDMAALAAHIAHAVVDVAVAADVALLAARVARLVRIWAVPGQMSSTVTVVTQGLTRTTLHLWVGAVSCDMARLVAAVTDILTGRAVAGHVTHPVTLVALLSEDGSSASATRAAPVTRGRPALRRRARARHVTRLAAVVTLHIAQVARRLGYCQFLHLLDFGRLAVRLFRGAILLLVGGLRSSLGDVVGYHWSWVGQDWSWWHGRRDLCSWLFVHHCASL